MEANAVKLTLLKVHYQKYYLSIQMNLPASLG